MATVATLLAICAAAVGFVDINAAAVASEAMRGAPVDDPGAMRLIAQRVPQPASLRFEADNLESRTAAIAALMRKQHPQWRDMTLPQQLWKIGLLAKGLIGVTSSTAAGVAPLANFSGNLTGIIAQSPRGLYLQRQTNCSLNLNTANYSIVLNGATSFTLSNTDTTPSYEKALHDLAQLPTNAGSFPGGCAEATLGVGSRPAVYLGRSSQNLQVIVAARYYAPKGTNALYYLTADASSNAVRTFAVDTSEPNISAVAAGDLNGDGLADIVGIDNSGTSAASVTVRIAKADGTFGAGVPYPLPGSVDEAAVLEDVNGDGKPDVIVATIDANTRQEYLSVLTGKGDGTLNTAVSFTISTPTYINSGGGSSPATIVNLIAADLRGNGRKDLVASNGLILLNNGNGTFAPGAKAGFAPRSATSNYGPNLAAGDLNGDRKTDLVVNNGAQIDIYLGNGDGSFNKGRSYATLDSVGYVSVTDIDGDGNPDIFVGLGNGGFFFGDQFGVGQAYALMGNGDGSFKGAPVAAGAYKSQNLADLNGDKKLDLVGVDGNTFTTYLGNSDGAFTPGAALSVPSFTYGGKTYSNPGVGAFSLVDVNGDGYPDLVWIPAQGTVDISTARSFYLTALNKRDGSFAVPTVTEFPTMASGSDFEIYSAVTSVQAADFNNDGKADLIFSFSSATYTGTSYQVGYFVLSGKGDGTFGTPKTLITSTVALGGFSPPQPPTAPAAIVDVNGDHFPDLVVVQGTGVGTLPGGGQGSRLVLFRGNGDATFGPASVLPAAPNPFSAPGFVVAADMNGDGRPDLVTLGQAEADGNGYLAISLGNGDGSF
ncbi:MAG: VCBS repeat-containing protein, partial [Rudaea sp.]